MDEVYVRTADLIKKLRSYEKDHLDILCLSITERDDHPEFGGPPSLCIQGFDSRDGEFAGAVEDFIDSDESLAIES